MKKASSISFLPDEANPCRESREVRERILELSSRYFELVPRGAGTTEVARPARGDGWGHGGTKVTDGFMFLTSS